MLCRLRGMNSVWRLGGTMVAAALVCAVVAAPAAEQKKAAPTTAQTAKPAAPPAKKEEGFQTAAPTAILIDGESGSVLYEKNADTLVAPASLSKLMTTEVVLNEIKQGRLKPSDEFIVSERAWKKGGAPSRTSSMFVPIHSKVAVDDLLHGVII